MHIPKTISILGYEWRIEHVEDLTDAGVPVDGLADHDTRVLSLDQSLKGKHRDHIFLHELNHCIFFELGLHNTKLSLDLEEVIVDNIAKGYLSIFNLNLKTSKAAPKPKAVRKKASRRRS